jgi:hypothetical protein
MMKSLRKAIVLVAATSAAFLAAPRHASSEVGGVHLNVTPFVGYGDWAKEINLDNKAYFGGRLGVGIGPYLGVEGYYGWMGTHTEYGTGDSLFSAPSTSPRNTIDLQLYGADLVLNLIPKSKFNPYLLGGWHEEKITSDGPGVKTFQNGAEFGGGVKIGVSRRAALRLELRDKLWSFGDDPTIPDPPGNDNIHNLFYNAGLQVSFGGATGSDADNDGVSEDKEQ